ncbi:MAG: flavodoxin domain-containing protein [Desulfomonilaceae bacterium]
MAKALIIFGSRSGATTKIADLIAQGISQKGVEAKVINALQIHKAEELEGYDAYVFGSPTYHGDMLPAMKTFLFLASGVDLAGKVGGSFGAFGWSGEAPNRIYDTMKHIYKMHMVTSPLRLQSALLPSDQAVALDYGGEIGSRVLGD